MVLVVKNPPANAGGLRDLGLIPGWGRFPGGGHGNPLQYSCLENPHEQRSLEGYSLEGRKELGTTEAAWHACSTNGTFAPQNTFPRAHAVTTAWASCGL